MFFPQRRISAVVDKNQITPPDLPNHFHPLQMPFEPAEVREMLEASDPVFRRVVGDSLLILQKFPDVDRVHVYLRENLPGGLDSQWPVDLVFIESGTGHGHLLEHLSTDHHWASDLSDDEVAILANICEAVHQSLPVTSWSEIHNFLQNGGTALRVDWLNHSTREEGGAAHRDVWIRFSYQDQDERERWGLTRLDDHEIAYSGFLPADVIRIREEEDQMTLMCLMDDIVFVKKAPISS